VAVDNKARFTELFPKHSSTPATAPRFADIATQTAAPLAPAPLGSLDGATALAESIMAAQVR